VHCIGWVGMDWTAFWAFHEHDAFHRLKMEHNE
jgi:hypothetical protein